MDSRSNSPSDYEIFRILHRSQKYYLRDLKPVNYTESPVPQITRRHSATALSRRQRSKSTDGIARKKNCNQRSASVPPANVRQRKISQFLFGESSSTSEKQGLEIAVFLRKTIAMPRRRSRTPSPKQNLKVERRGRKKSPANKKLNNSVERKSDCADGGSAYKKAKKKTVSPEKNRDYRSNVCTSSSTAGTSREHHESHSSQQGKDRSKSTCNDYPEKDNPKSIKNLTSETKKGENEYILSKNQAKEKSKRRNSTGAKNQQPSSRQSLPSISSVPSETSKGRNRHHSPKKHVEKGTMRRKSTGDKSVLESNHNPTAPADDLKVREMKYTLCEKRLEAMYREDDRKKIFPNKTGHVERIKISIPFDKIFSGNGDDNEEIIEILSNGNDANMVHFKKKLIQRSVPTDQNSIQEVTQSQKLVEDLAQSSSSSEVPQGSIHTSSERAESVRTRSTSLDESQCTSLPLSSLEMSPGSTCSTSVSPPSPVSGNKPEKRQGVKRQTTSSTPNASAVDYSSERNAASSFSSEQNGRSSLSSERNAGSSLSSKPKQPIELRQSSSVPVADSVPSPVRRPRSNSVKDQKQLNTDKTPPSDPKHQDDSSAARNMNCTITRLETPNSIPVNIRIGTSNDLETTKTLLVLVDSILRSNELSVENLMALNKFYRDLKNYQINNDPDEGLKRDIEDRTKQLVGFIAKHLVGAQCNLGYIVRMLSIDLQPHEEFFRRYIREIKHYARDQQSMETLINNLSKSEEIILPPKSSEVPTKVVRTELQQDPRTHNSRRVDPRTIQARPPALHYNQLQETIPRLPFNEVPRNNFRMINPPQMPYFNHNQQVQSNVFLNHPMFTVPPPTHSAPINNNENWRGPVQMIYPPNYTIPRMLVPPNPRSNVILMPHRFDSPGSQTTSSRPTGLPVTAPPTSTGLRDSNGTTSNGFPNENSENSRRFKTPSYDINMNNPAHPNFFNTLDTMNKASLMSVMNDSRNMVRSTPPPTHKNVNNPAATPSGYFTQRNPRNIVRLMSPVNNIDANNTSSTVSTSFAHQNQNNRSTFTPSPNTETSYSSVPYAPSNLISNGIEMDNLNHVATSKKSPLDSNAAVIVHQNGSNSFNRTNTTQNEILVKNSCTAEKEIAVKATEIGKPIINHPITVVDQNMTVILTRNPIKKQVGHPGDMSVTKLKNVKSEDEDLKDQKRVWYYAQQLKRWKKVLKDTDPKIYQQILNRCENDSSVIIVDDNEKEDDNDVCFVAQYSKESSNNNITQAGENSSRGVKEDIPDEEILTIATRENSFSLQLRSNIGIINETSRENIHSRGVTETNTQLVPSTNFQIHNSNNGAIKKARNSNSYYIQSTSSMESIRDDSSNFQLRGVQTVKDNLEMVQSSSANEPIHVELQTSNDTHSEVVNGYPRQFQANGNNVGNTRDLLPFQLERASDSTGGLQGMDWRVWMSHEGERRISNIHETPTVASRNYSSHDKWFQVGYHKVGTSVSNRERIIKMVQSKLVYDEVNHSLVSLIEDTNGNERRIETFLPSNVLLSTEDFLSNPELYIKEYETVANHAPLGYSQYYQYVTGFQIVRNKPPVSFLTFLQLNNAGQLRELFTKFVNSLEKNGDQNSLSPV